MTSPIYVAIDTPDMDRARTIAAAVKRHAGGLKLGLEFFCHNGRHGVMELVGFIEERYGITVRDEDLTPENFQTLVSIQEYVDSRRNSAA